MSPVLVITDERLAHYGFGQGHPFGPDRWAAFMREFERRGLDARCQLGATRRATRAELELFHTPAYLDRLADRARAGEGYLDGGDTPAFPGIDAAAADVVGATLVAAQALLGGTARRAFVPIAGLHHARRDGAAGFCALNDCGVAIEWLRQVQGLSRIAYVDIDAHHGDGVFYAFEDDPEVIVVDVHEDGRFLYPGTGEARERGRGPAAGTKLNLPLAPGAGDAEFAALWPQALAHLDAFRPEFVLLQCGADSLAGDPLTHLALSSASYRRVAADLGAFADRWGHGRVLATGGGGYHRPNIAAGWNAVVEGLLGEGLG